MVRDNNRVFEKQYYFGFMILSFSWLISKLEFFLTSSLQYPSLYLFYPLYFNHEVVTVMQKGFT